MTCVFPSLIPKENGIYSSSYLGTVGNDCVLKCPKWPNSLIGFWITVVLTAVCVTEQLLVNERRKLWKEQPAAHSSAFFCKNWLCALFSPNVFIHQTLSVKPQLIYKFKPASLDQFHTRALGIVWKGLGISPGKYWR